MALPSPEPRRTPRGAPLFIYLFIGMAGLSVLPVVVLAVLQFARWEQVQLDEASEAQRAIVSQVASNLGDLVDTHAHVVEVLARSLEGAPKFDAETAGRELRARREHFPSFAAMYAADAAGRSFAAEPAIGADGKPSSGRDYSGRDYYRELLRTGASTVSQIQRGKISGEFNLQIAVPVRREGALVGVVVGSLDLATLTHSLERLGPLHEEQLMVVDRLGRALNDDGPERPAMRAVGALALYQPPAGAAEVRTGTDERGRPVLAHLARLEERNLGWFVVASRTRASIEAEVGVARKQALAVAGAMLLLGLLVSGLFAERFARPIRRLAQMAREVSASGASPVRPDGFVPREVDDVTEAVVQMVGRLREQSSQLEQTVSERTAQLQASNQELQRNLATLKETQGRLATSDRLASVGTLAAGVAHEINNPLAYVISNLSWVLEQLAAGAAPGKAEMEALNEAHTGAQRVRKIVLDLRIFARSSEGEGANVDLIDVLRAALNVAGAELHHRARLVEQLGPVPLVRADASRLGQVLLNLLVNAVQAIPEGDAGHHEIRVSSSTDAQGRAVLSVSDTGCGIAPEIRGRIFEPFFTTKQVGQGTGLGLAICHGVVRAMGGEIHVESEVGKGSTFTVVLPPGRFVDEEPATVEAPSSRRGRLLVIDDEEMIGRSVQRMLGQQHEVTWVVGARDALARLERGESWDVILCDVMMPDMGGAELYDEVKAKYPKLADRFLFITGGAFSPSGQALVAAMEHRCIGKPFDWAEVRVAIAAVLDGPSNVTGALEVG